MIIENIKYPSEGQFSAGEVAALNNIDKLKLYPFFIEDVKKGKIVFVGKRPQPNGQKGKPTNLYTLATNFKEGETVVLSPQPKVEKSPKETYKWPTENFTHAQLAELNGKEKVQVYQFLQEGLKNGSIIKIGYVAKPEGQRGRAASIFHINDGSVKPISVEAPPSVEVTPQPRSVVPNLPLDRPPHQEEIVMPPTMDDDEPRIIPIKEPPTPFSEEMTPAVAPPSLSVVEPQQEEIGETIEVATVNLNPDGTPMIAWGINGIGEYIRDAEVLNNMPCPICGTSTLGWKDKTGFMVYCNAPVSKCRGSENPYGHSRSFEAAYKVMIDKFSGRRGSAKLQ